MTPFYSGRGLRAYWLLLFAIPAYAAQVVPTPEKDKASTPIVAPKPGPVRRSELSAAFTKPSPTTLADLKSIQQHVEALSARVSPAVVAVEVGNGSGSGVLITADGLVLTAGHVCGDANRNVRFTFADGKTAHGKTLGVDLESDTGLMQITDRGSWPFVAVGDLAQGHLGDWVLALGHPGGYDAKRSLVVRLGRIIRMAPNVLQTDCTIAPGDSGGPLFDMYGRVIGIHTSITGSLADNFHVPITGFYDTWDSLVKSTAPAHPGPPRAYVGAEGVDDDAGCRLNVVEKNGPAAKAGLKVGDVVVKVEGREIKAAAAFRRWVAEASPGEKLNLEVQRAGKVIALTVKLDAPKNHK